MIVVDLNLLLYATNADAPNHAPARAWWEAQLGGDETVALAWAVVLGFLRLTTHPRVMPRPLAAEQAIAILDDWLRQPAVRVVQPTDRHWGIIKDLLSPLGAAGNLTADAHLAALAIEHGAWLCSTDNDFGRFAGLRWRNPIAP